LILTTVKDGQTNVQIDLYEGEVADIDTATYVGSLLIEDIAPATAGEAEIELRIGMDAEGKLSARAEDMASGESQSLSVSLESLAEDNIYDIPEFELGSDFDSWEDSDEDSDQTTDEFLDEFPDQAPGAASDANEDETFDFDDSSGQMTGVIDDELEDEEEEPAYIPPQKRKPLLLALFILFGIAAVAALTIFLYKVFEGPSAPPLEARGDQQAVEADAPEEIASEPAETESGSSEGEIQPESSTAEFARDGPVVAAASDVSPSTSGAELGGVWYWIRWGDTLWDISSSFYRTPWRYGRIAEENSIRNPDLIFAGAKIFIPKNE
jgi:hypothetical protein